MLGRFKGLALATTAVLSIATFSPAANAEKLIWSIGIGEDDRTWGREDCLLGFCTTNWKKESLNGLLLLKADPPNGFETLHFGVPQGSTFDNDGVSNNDLSGLRVEGIVFETQAGEFRLRGNQTFLLASDAGFGLINFSDSEQNVDFDIFIAEDQTWQTNDGLFDINGDVDVGSHALTITGPGSTNIDGDIDGFNSSKIIKQGNGTLSLDGDNSGFTGDIDVTNGRLRLDGGDNISTSTNINLTGDAVLDLNGTGEDIGGLSGSSGTSVDLTSSASLRIGLNNENTTYAGNIFGNGSLNKGGTGTTTLTGNNSYSGGTTVSGGTLKGDTQALQGDIENNATLEFNNTLGNGIYTGNLSGTGTTRFTGGFRFELRGNNGAASGDMIVTGGTTLRMGPGNAVGNSTVILNNGELDLNGTVEDIGGLAGSNGQVDLSDNGDLGIGYNNADTTFNGTIFGNGSLRKHGTGTSILRGTNSYTGDTTVNSGTLRGDTNSLRGNIVNNANVEFDQSSNGTYSGSMSGTGALVKDGSGTVTLTGNNTYSGGTTVDGGTLKGNTTSLRGNIVNNANVEFDQGVSGTYAPVMSGSGSLTKSGNGTLFLNGNNSYSGSTVINDGSLALSGSGAIDGSSDLSVAMGAIFNVSGRAGGYTYGGTVDNQGRLIAGASNALTLTGDVSGAGSYQGVVNINGTFRPGNSPALINADTLNFGASNALFMEIGGYGRGTEFDAIDATSITLNGLLDIALLDLGNSFSPMSGDTFDLIVADQIFGEFSSFNFAALAEGLFFTTQLITTQLGMVYQLVVDGQLVGVAVPAPGAMLLLLVGVAGVCVMRRRKTA